MSNIGTEDVGAAIISLLTARRGAARFVPELVAALARPDPAGESVASAGSAGSTEEPQSKESQTESTGQARINRALNELESAGIIIVRDHYCADPHLTGVDLRIAALVSAPAEGTDRQSEAVAAIEALWQRWLGDYLATHRCT